MIVESVSKGNSSISKGTTIELSIGYNNIAPCVVVVVVGKSSVVPILISAQLEV